MNLVKKILGKLNGLKYPQEYLCLANESFENPFFVYVLIDSVVAEDITKQNNFVGYSPVIFALSSEQTASLQPGEISIVFTTKKLVIGNDLNKKDATALLVLKRINKQPLTSGEDILYFEAIKGQHRFLSSFHQFIIQLQNRLYQKKPGNIFLPGNLYKQVQIAYSVPRNISLVTVGQNDKYNLFPTDLHGPIGENYYIISLRHEGKACAQVMDTRRILLSRVRSEFYKTVYSLGKNHMQELKGKENFPLSAQLSSHLQLPIPLSAVFYRELELKDHFTHGIHRIMLFQTLYQQELQPDPSTLSHIHTVYASWRYNKGLAGNYLLR